MIEQHPYEPFIDNSTKLLIIGTTPPMRFTQRLELNEEDVDFYYGSSDNYFWDIIGDVFGERFRRDNSITSITQRKSFLKRHGLGLVDIVLEFIRLDNDASDFNLKVLKFQNIYDILRQNPQIDKVFFTGYSGPNSAESLMSKHLSEFKVYNTIISHPPPKHKIFVLDNRKIDTFSLFSPSGAARKKYSDRLNQYYILKNGL